MAPSDPSKQTHSIASARESSSPDSESSQVRSTTIPETSVNGNSPEKSSNRSSWYNKTWPRKAPPIAQVARESISSASNSALEIISTTKNSVKPKSKRSPSLNLTLGGAQSSRSMPVVAETTKVNALSTGIAPSPTKTKFDISGQTPNGSNETRDSGPRPPDKTGDTNDESPKTAEPPKPTKPTTPDDGRSAQTEGAPVSTTADGGPGWFGWFSRPAVEAEKISNSAPPSLNSPDPPLPPQDVAPRTQAPIADTIKLPAVPEDSKLAPSKRTWLQMLSGSSAEEESGTSKDKGADDSHGRDPGSTRETDPSVMHSLAASSPEDSTAAPAAVAAVAAAAAAEPSAPPKLTGDGSKSSGWVLWSRDRKLDESSTTSNEAQVGELAVSNTPSQKRPKQTSISLESSKPMNSSQEPSRGTAKAAKDMSALHPRDDAPPTPTRGTAETQKDGSATPKSAKFLAAAAGASKQLQQSVPNLLLPSFNDTFSLQETPSLLQLLGRFLSYSSHAEAKHVYRVKEFPRLKSALAIGVHGYFPAPLIRTVLGQPTGTSIKFADMAAKAIRKWTESRGYSCEVKTAALEGEGRISERVDLLWKLLLNWIDEIRKADFVMIACHSQGVPVATMLIAKLVDFGCVNSAKIGICAMAGVSLGPFPDYKSRWIGGSAGELFEFSNSSSTVSKDYLAAVETILNFGVRVTYIGSIDDQLVSLESSTFSPISHPHIYRAVFVDGRIHAPNFLVHLVGFALKLRNLGVQDHGLIRELSSPLAGSLYTGEGHSRIYEDAAVYDLAVRFALETNAMQNALLSQRPSPSATSNPYILPWAVRGILEEDFVKSDLRDEAHELLKQFDDWKPATKVLKDVKFRLEGIRSKL